MYAQPETREAHDLFWQRIRDRLHARGIAAPDQLDWQIGHMESWARPDLVLGQICNLPYRARFRGKVTVIGASDYGLRDCAAGHYYSVFVVRAEDPVQDPRAHAARFAYNEGLSNSGWGAPQVWAAARGFAFAPFLQTGAHAESARAVAEGRANLAALDVVTWANLQRFWPEAARLRVIGRTDSSPGQSFITRLGEDPAPYRLAIAEAIADLRSDAPEAADLVALRGIVDLPAKDYDIPLPPGVTPAH